MRILVICYVLQKCLLRLLFSNFFDGDLIKFILLDIHQMTDHEPALSEMMSVVYNAIFILAVLVLGFGYR